MGHVFELYAAHHGGQCLRTAFSAPDVHYDRDGKTASLSGLSGSASLHGKEVVLTVVNPHVTESRETEVILAAASIRSATATVLANLDIHAHNTFVQREAVTPRNQAIEWKGAPMRFVFPPASVTKIVMTLA